MNHKRLQRLVRMALREDVGARDLTTALVVPESSVCRVELVAKASGVLSGIGLFRLVFEAAGAELDDWDAKDDGTRFEPGDVLARFQAPTRPVLTGERTAMNFVQHLSGVAAVTAEYVRAVEGSKTRICDTRKTTPLFRDLEKAAIRHGGGVNHRHALYDGVLIKENHIAAAGGITTAVQAARAGVHHLMRVEVEVRDLTEFDEAVAAGADVILLDNMSLEEMKAAAGRVNGKGILLEASGNVTLERVADIAKTGVDFISVGALTHSAPAADLSLLITPTE